jgi:hypothetical protein
MHITNCQSHILDDMLVENFEHGVFIDRGGAGLIEQCLFRSYGGGASAMINYIGTSGVFSSVHNFIAEEGPSDAVYYISPNVGSAIEITSTRKTGAGEFYKTGDTGSITGFVDISTPSTAVTVTNSGGDAQFNAIGHGLVVGETPVITGCTETSYNGEDKVTSATTNTFFVGKDYVSDDSGFFETTTCQVNSTAHGLPNGEDISVFDTVYFGGGYCVFGAQTNTFEITLGKTFPVTGSETGTWDTGSLTQKSKYVEARQNGDQPDSQNIGSFLMSGNTTDTEVNPGTYVPLNLGGLVVPGNNIELWTVVDTTTGEIRYDGLRPTSIDYIPVISASAQGNPQVFSFRLEQIRNGSPISMSDDIDLPVAIAGSVVATTLRWAVEIEPGDSLILKTDNLTGVADLLVSTIKGEAR